MYKIKLSPYAKIFYTEWMLDPDSSRYNLSIDQILYGILDVNRLRDALKKYISEHAILNSHIQNINEEPYWIRNSNINELEYSDSLIDTSELLSYVSRSFDLHNEPLYRFKLLRINKDTHRFILVFHHIVIDGSTSLDVGVFEAITNYYNNKNYSTEYTISDQIKLISDLTDKLSTNLTQNKDKYKEFWHQKLLNIEPINLGFLKLDKNYNKLNKTELETESYNPKEDIYFSYGDSELSKLNQIKLKYGITPYAYGQCIFALLLHRYTNQDRLAISCPIGIKEGLDFIYGTQLNTNLIPYQFDQNTTIIDLFNQSKMFFNLTIRNDIKHGYYPIINIIQDGVNKQLLSICFVQTFFREHPFKFNGITKIDTLTELGIDGVAKDILLFEHDARKNKLNYRIRYDKSTISSNLLNIFVSSYKKLYSEILDDLLTGNSNKQISDYQILNKNQYYKIIHEFNKTDKNYHHDKTIHKLFEEQVLKTPNNIAIVYEDIKLTYQELNNKANQLANYLQQNYDIKPDDLIALYLDRSEQILIAILGVLKAGGAYVPIDPNYPNNRIEYILSDIKTKVVLANDTYTNKIQQIIKNGLGKKKTDVLAIDSKDSKITLYSQKNIVLTTSTTSTNLAYVIYTSGTTGNPKGVLIEHQSLINFVSYTTKFVTTEDIIISYINYSFDAINAEIYPALLSGNQLHILSGYSKINLDYLYKYITKNSITFIVLPSAIATEFSLNYDLNLTKLRVMIVGGDVYMGKLEPIKIINQYGPTESTVCATSHSYVANDSYKNIGKPIDNVKCYIVDNNLNILPIGAVGELVIGGENLARGYLNLPELTAKKFIPNPFQTPEEKFHHKNGRLYKTGDLARLLPNGNIEYIGRNDFQVKIRGYRIELGEIENKLLTYPGVKQAVVLAKERSSTNNITTKYLLAYYVSDKKLDEEKIQAHLATQLPEYMLPQILVHISNLPLTQNGKLDKKALPEPELKSEYEPPKNKLEENLCAIYAKVLNLPIEQIGITNDFFKMGGDSISSIQLVYIIRQKLPLNISVTDIFTYRTVEQLVKNVLTNQSIQKNITNIKREDNPIGRSGFLPIQEWFFDNIKNGLYKKYNHWNQSFIIKTPELDIEVLKLSVEKLLQHHDAFRFRYKNFEKNYIKADLTKESENIKTIDISDLTDAEIQNKLIEIQSNFNIETGPVYTIAYLHGYKDKTARLFFAMHHLIIDSVSWRILTHDISKLYELLKDQRNTNKTSQELLGQKGTSYRQWVEEVKNYKPSQQELNNWDDTLKDYIHIPKNGNKESHDELLLTSQLTQMLLTKTNEAYNTQVNDILLSALSRTLAQVFNRPINHITLESHGREEIKPEIDITKTIGWFTTMYPVRLTNQSTISDLIKTTKENLKNIPNKGIGYGSVKGYKNLPNINFNYLGQINSTEDFWTITHHIISVDPQNQNSNILDIYGYVVNNALNFHVSCNNSLSFNAKVFADKFKSNLEELIDHCSNKEIADPRVIEKKCKNINEDKEISLLLHQVKSSYAKKTNKTQLNEQLQNKIDCYLKNANKLPQDLFLQKPITNVLLTGSTGFLGCNLLNQLLELTNYNIFLLIRADSKISAIDRINKKFQFYFDKKLDDVYEKRVFILKSELADNYLGLSEIEYKGLSIKIDSIIHAAALVKHYGDYDNFYLQNVQSTINLLEFAKLTKLKDFHYVSTHSVLGDSCVPICTEDDMPSYMGQDNVYLKTKSQGEYQTIKYRNYGIKSNIYRVGTLAFIAENFRMQENLEENGFLNWAKCLFKLQCVAKEISNVEISPTDLTAKAIVKLFDKDSLSNKTHHVFNPDLFNISESVNNEYKIKILGIDEFIDKIIDEMEYGINDNLIMKFLLYQGWMDSSYTKSMNAVKVMQDRTQLILKHLDFMWSSQATIKAFIDSYCRLLNNNME